jgi:hypothetical protein
MKWTDKKAEDGDDDTDPDRCGAPYRRCEQKPEDWVGPLERYPPCPSCAT